jgi:hypothetical protein
VLLCFIAREADAPGAYDEIIKAWSSIDDLTGPEILFLFAGPLVRKRHESKNIYKEASERLLFSADALILHSKRMDDSSDRSSSVIGHFALGKLRNNTEDKHPQTRDKFSRKQSTLARHHPRRPEREDITTAQTSQITQLRKRLLLKEEDIPCLHFSFFDGSSPIHHKVDRRADFYATLKAVAEAIESRSNTKAEIARIRSRQAALRQEQQQAAAKPVPPQQLFRHVVSLLEKAAPHGGEGQSDIQELITALRAHAEQPSKESRRIAFDRNKSTRRLLSGHSDWGAIRSSVQRLIDVVNDSDLTDTSSSSETNTASFEDQKKAALARIERERSELESLMREQDLKLKSVLTAAAIQARVKKAASNGANGFSKSFVVVGARQELDAVRHYLDLENAERKPYDLSENWPAERISIDQGTPVEFGLILAAGQGLEDMADVLSAIQKYSAPKTIILVGMMAGIPGKSRLLDVQAPRNIINGTRLGTRSGRIVPEPHGRDVDPTLHHRLQSLDPHRRKIADIPLVTHKHSVCVAGKFDDLAPELAQAALASDPENVIGIEMEGSALTAKQATQSRSGEATGYIMIKGVADYAGTHPIPEEVAKLRSVLESFEGGTVDVLLANPDPTTNKPLKSVLQKIATIRAFRVALALLAEG